MLSKRILFSCLLFLFLITSPAFSFSQVEKIDSIEKSLMSMPDNEMKVTQLKRLGGFYINEQKYDGATRAAKRLLDLSNRVDSPRARGYYYYLLGSIFIEKGNFDEAIANFNNAVPYLKKSSDLEGLAGAYGKLGNAYYYQGLYPRSIGSFLEALKIFDKLNLKEEAAGYRGNIGAIYNKIGDNVNALKYYNDAMKRNEEMGNRQGLAINLVCIANLYSGEGKENVKAEPYFLRALKINEELGDKSYIANNYTNLALVKLYQNQLDVALEYILKAIDIDKSLEDKNAMAQDYGYLALIYIEQKKYRESEEYLIEALRLAKEMNALDFQQNYYGYLSQVYEATGRYEQSLIAYKTSTKLKDSLFGEEKHRDIMQKQLQFVYDQKEADAKAKFEKEQTIKQAEIERQKFFRNAFIAGAIVLLGFALFVMRSLRQSRNSNRIIEGQKLVVVEKNKEITDSISYAKRIQEAILPPEEYIRKHLPEHFVLYIPKDIVAGDFYWMEIVNDIIFIAAADSTGHGVPGALVSVVCGNALNRSVKEFKLVQPGAILDKTRELVLETFSKSGEIKDGMDISLCTINKSTGKVAWSGANNPLCYLSQGVIKEIKADKQPIGKSDHAAPFTTHEINVEKGDIIYLITDGYSDQFGGPEGKKFKYRSLKELFSQMNSLPIEDQKRKLESTFSNWKGSLEQIDDVTIVGFKI